MRLLLRADASADHGYGHVVRALAVAETALARGHDVMLLGSVPAGWLRRSLDSTGVQIVGERPSWHELPHFATSWRADAVLVDSYEAPADLRRGINDAGCLLINVEDGTWGRRPGDVVLDQTWVPAGSDARPVDGSPLVLRGSRFALVRAAVRRARVARAGPVAPRAHRPLVVVVMGGTDAAGVLHASVSMVVNAGAAADVVAVVSEAHNTDDLTRLSSPTTRVSVARPGASLPQLASSADLVVAAAGTTVTELCCIGVPMAILPVVPNQVHVVDALEAAGAAVALEAPPRMSASMDHVKALMMDPRRRRELAENAVALVDGLGGVRLLRAVETQLGAERTRPIDLLVRQAGWGDRSLLLEWRNEDDTRRWSRQRERVSQDAHDVWLNSVLADESRHLLILEDVAANPVASVRWDADGSPAGSEWEVSITVSPDERGRGIAGAALALAERWLRDREPHVVRLLATVHEANEASRALFQHAGYESTAHAADGEWLQLGKAPTTPGPS